jgi:hypothetical protein
MNLNELFESNLPPHVKKSDVPPALRSKLTMKDIEAERPKGAYRFRVGEKYFMSYDAAKDFATGTGEKVERVAEEVEEPAAEKKSSGIRVRRGGADEHIIDEAKKDACYNKVKSRYKVWPSAYASGALVQCRKKGAKNWGNKS